MLNAEKEFDTLSDDQLIAQTHRLVMAERQATAALLRALMQLDTRRLYLREGCSSLFTYWHPRTPALTVLRRVAACDHGSTSAAPSTSDRGESLRSAASTIHSTGDLSIATEHAIEKAQSASPSNDSLRAPVLARPTTRPLSSDQYRLQVTISNDTHEKLRRAKDLLRHTIPTGDLAEILDRALTLLVADLERRRCAAAVRPRKSAAEPAPGSRAIPAFVKRAVWQRDEGRCAFVGSTGRCRETGFLEFHHVEPFASGGAATVENIQLRCRAHNLYEAALFFDDGESSMTGQTADG